MTDKKQFETPVLIIGGGVTGTGVSRDLALRGIPSIVLEKETVNAGASGRNHGLLHSGARYVSSDRESAVECKKESAILKKIAPHCIEETNGLFVALKDDDENYIHEFPVFCKKAGINCEAVPVKELLKAEPALSSQVVAAYRVKDGSVEPFHVSLENMSQAIGLGARYFNYCRVEKIVKTKGKITKVWAKDLVNRRMFEIRPDVVVNAAGAWSDRIARMAGVQVDVIYSKGSLLITHNRVTTHVINRLRPPSDGDILVPGGTVSIFGTTSLRTDTPDHARPTAEEADILVSQAKQIVPAMADTRYIRAYAGVRPLVMEQGAAGKERGDDRNVSRGFSLIDHAGDGADNFVTITGGKMTTFRLMAEKTCDIVAGKLNIKAECTTHKIPLQSDSPSGMTEAGMSFKLRSAKKDPQDITMCECEMISRGQFRQLIDWLKKNRKTSDLNALRIHSRLGKGACQGTFCSQRVTAFMYDELYLKKNDGIYNIKDLLYERFYGQRPVLWGTQLAQSELNEALFCGFYGLEMTKE